MSVGLIVFTVVVVINVIGLLLDLTLHSIGWTTVSELVWEGDWLIGAFIIALQLVGTVGLVSHFWGVHDNC